MIPYGHQTIDDADVKAVISTLKSDWLTQGPKIGEFEKHLARYCGAKYAVAVSSGTAALHLAYLAAGLRSGDEAITTPNTFAATTNMFLAVGARAVFCDIRLDTYNLDERKIEKLVTKKTKAIIPVHFAGQPCEMEPIYRLAKKHKLAVIEDACHALGARYKNRRIGSMRGDMAVFSFHPVKSITTGEGGAVITNSRKYYKKILHLRSHGIHKDKSGKNVMTELGYNYRLTDLQAALGITQLQKLEGFLALRRQVAAAYRKSLAGLKEIVLPAQAPGAQSSWHLYVIRTSSAKVRDPLVRYLKAKGIGVNFHYPAVYSHPYYRRHGYGRMKLQNAELYSQSCLTLPCYPGLASVQVKYVCDQIKKFFAART